MEAENKRILYLDVLKVLAVIGVICIHVVAPEAVAFSVENNQVWWLSNVLNVLTRWAVPVFFMISGTLLLNSPKADDYGSFIKSRFIKIGIPFIIWSIFYALINHYYLLGEDFRVLEMFQTLAYDILFDKAYVHLWFIYDLFILYLITPFLRKIVKNATSKEMFIWLVLWFITSIIHLLTRQVLTYVNAPIPHYFKIMEFPMVAGLSGYYVLGYFLNTIKLKKPTRLIIYFISIGAMIMSMLGTYYLSSMEGQLVELFYGNFSLTTCITAIGIFVCFRNIDFEKHLNKGLKNLVVAISTSSFGIYIIHMLFILYLSQKFALLRELSFVLYYSIIIILTLLFSCFSVKLIKLIPRLGKYLI